ncbi:hypothetical protein G6675_02000 [Polynucleobacter paneuropaeus]|nr:hypothetical protein [Polynucleobacter paneuropaeus]MBT8599719.1 hypothetical protein [Polynucleobacter paneuropaeus]
MNKSLKVVINVWDIVAFITPCLFFIEFSLIGRLFLPEIILLVVFLYFFCIRCKSLFIGPSRNLLILGLIWLLGQIISDIYRQSDIFDSMKGCSNITFLLLEFSAIYFLLHKSQCRLILFGLGVITGQVLEYLINPNIFAQGGDYWKFGIAFPVTFILVMFSCIPGIYRVKLLPAFILAIAAILNFVLEYRSLGGICLITCIYLIAQRKSERLNPYKIKSYLYFVLSILLISIAALKFYGLAAESGLLGGGAQEKYEIQSKGVFGLLLGGRQESIVSSLAIMDSPIIGHGSWAKDSKYSAMLPELLEQYGYDKSQAIIYGEELEGLIPTHSFLFGAWVSAGILGAIFWFWMLAFCQKILFQVNGIKFPLQPLVIFISIYMIWNIFFSPLGAEGRVYAAYFIVFLFFTQKNYIKKIQI